MLLDQILRESLEELSVPLDDGFLLLASHFLNIIILLFESFENVIEFLFLREDLYHCTQEPSIDIFDKSLTVRVNDLTRMLES